MLIGTRVLNQIFLKIWFSYQGIFVCAIDVNNLPVEEYKHFEICWFFSWLDYQQMMQRLQTCKTVTDTWFSRWYKIRKLVKICPMLNLRNQICTNTMECTMCATFMVSPKCSGHSSCYPCMNPHCSPLQKRYSWQFLSRYTILPKITQE